jgi:protein phosphatase
MDSQPYEALEAPLDLGEATDVGRERENNEDGKLLDRERGLLIVCDGMGGMAAGEKATETALVTLDAFLHKDRIEAAAQDGDAGLHALLGEAFRQADAAVRELQQQRRSWRGMGCTVVAALLRNDRLHLGNMGDSRAYLFRPQEEPALLTVDHTVAAELVKQGDLTPEQARHHALRHQLCATLGHASTEYPPAFQSIPLHPGDQIVLCSDGLWDLVEAEEIARILHQAPDAQQAAQDLIDAANNAGGEDNITVLVLRMKGPFPSTSKPSLQNAEELGKGLPA